MRRQALPEPSLVAELARIMASSPSPTGELLELALVSVEAGPGEAAAALKFDAEGGDWAVVLGSPGFGPELSPELAAQLRAVIHEPQPADHVAATDIDGGHSCAIQLRGSGQLLGLLVLIGCTAERWAAVPYSVRIGLTMCLTGGVVRETARIEAANVQRSARAIRRLFEEGAHARDIGEAGTVLARVAAEAFETERAGMYVVDTDGRVAFAVGVGVSSELSDALAASLVGKIAADSPVWRTLERNGGPDLIDDASTAAVRPGGFVQTLQFQSYVAIPLLSKAGPLGMVICGEASRRRSWTAGERRLATQFALEGALIVDAARLRESERAQLAQITHQAMHDDLTGVPNRTLLTERLRTALETAAAERTKVALLLLDLDDFKRVNETLGHRYGDQLLRQVAVRLGDSLRGSDTLARLGGDEFAVLISEDADTAQAYAMADRIDSMLAVPVDLDGIQLNAVASIGIALYPDHADTATDLLQRADIAMYAAKAAADGPMLYEPSQNDSTVDKLTLYTELRQAITEGELTLAFQPKLDLHTNTITGVETLVRWHHPRRGLLMPDSFLPMAESTGLIHSLTEWVVRNALQHWAVWHTAGVTLDLAVNVSSRNLLDQELLSRVADLVTDSEASHHLILEVTETAVMVSPKDSALALADIRALGVRISMDDFGTGYSSLALLGQLPVDELKVDRLLVRDVEGSEVNTALIEAVVSVGHRLGLSVVAEGIETGRTLLAIHDLGCDLGQGYFISLPIASEEVVKLARMPRLPISSGAPSRRPRVDARRQDG